MVTFFFTVCTSSRAMFFSVGSPRTLTALSLISCALFFVFLFLFFFFASLCVLVAHACELDQGLDHLRRLDGTVLVFPHGVFQQLCKRACLHHVVARAFFVRLSGVFAGALPPSGAASSHALRRGIHRRE